jgi:cytochrome bd-type quinol oxidase subunit 2
VSEATEPRGHRDARPTSTGAGRVLVAVYGVFALSATARAAVQIASKFGQAPLAYLLSALAGVVYILATAGLASTRSWSRPLAWAAVAFELAGVLVVGTLTVLDTGDFPDDTVWSVYGRGYGFIPLVLPLVGLWWLRRTGSGRTGRATADGAR